MGFKFSSKQLLKSWMATQWTDEQTDRINSVYTPQGKCIITSYTFIYFPNPSRKLCSLNHENQMIFNYISSHYYKIHCSNKHSETCLYVSWCLFWQYSLQHEWNEATLCNSDWDNQELYRCANRRCRPHAFGLAISSDGACAIIRLGDFEPLRGKLVGCTCVYHMLFRMLLLSYNSFHWSLSLLCSAML